MFKRICSILCTLALCMGMLCVPAAASEAKTYDEVMTTEAEIYVEDESDDEAERQSRMSVDAWRETPGINVSEEGIEPHTDITEAEGREIQAYDEDGNIILHENENVQALSELVLRGGVSGIRIVLSLGRAR